MSDRDEEAPPPFRPDHDPFLGFEVSATVDGAAFQAGQIVRITVAAVNNSSRFVVHRYPGWRRFDLTVRDRHHRVVAHSELDRSDEEGFGDRWLPGQMLLFPVYGPSTRVRWCPPGRTRFLVPVSSRGGTVPG